MNPSTGRTSWRRSRAYRPRLCVVLPNNKNIIMASEQAQKLADRKVIVLPTRTVPQGMTAMLNFDPELKPEENAVGMMQAADHVSTGLITYAARDSEFDGKPIKKGEIMAPGERQDRGHRHRHRRHDLPFNRAMKKATASSSP